MRNHSRSVAALSLCATLVLLSRCGAGVTPSGASADSSALEAVRLAQTVARYRLLQAQPDLEPSWVLSNAGSAPLLYVSDFHTDAVFVYDYSTHRSAGRLTGLNAPYGQCVDAGHNVWIAEFGASDVVEYAHGGKSPIRRLRTDGHAIGCAIDRASGNLAVANFYTKSGSGSIQVWHKAGGFPSTYRSSKLHYLWPPAYDDNGDVFAEGQTKTGRSGVVELTRNGRALRDVSLRGATISYAGGALWDGQHLALTDQDFNGKKTTAIYRVSIVGLTLKVIDLVNLTDTCKHDHADVVQPFVTHPRFGPATVVGGNLWCAKRFDYWNYPAGGKPRASLRGTPQEPVGQSVSLPTVRIN